MLAQALRRVVRDHRFDHVVAHHKVTNDPIGFASAGQFRDVPGMDFNDLWNGPKRARTKQRDNGKGGTGVHSRTLNDCVPAEKPLPQESPVTGEMMKKIPPDLC